MSKKTAKKHTVKSVEPTKSKSTRPPKGKQLPTIGEDGLPVARAVVRANRNKDGYYVNPEEFHQEIVEYYKTPFNMTPSDSLGSRLIKIASRLSYLGKFQNYSYREEMVNLAVERMLKALLGRKYDLAKGNNPFSYFTSIAWNSFRATIKEEGAYGKVLKQYMESSYDSQYEFGNGYENVRRRPNAPNDD